VSPSFRLSWNQSLQVTLSRDKRTIINLPSCTDLEMCREEIQKNRECHSSTTSTHIHIRKQENDVRSVNQRQTCETGHSAYRLPVQLWKYYIPRSRPMHITYEWASQSFWRTRRNITILHKNNHQSAFRRSLACLLWHKRTIINKCPAFLSDVSATPVTRQTVYLMANDTLNCSIICICGCFGGCQYQPWVENLYEHPIIWHK
jgi:hypothetical protein